MALPSCARNHVVTGDSHAGDGALEGQGDSSKIESFDHILTVFPRFNFAFETEYNAPFVPPSESPWRDPDVSS
jgi:hypothetical protein